MRKTMYTAECYTVTQRSVMGMPVLTTEERKEKSSAKDGFATVPLTAEQRKALKVEQYYRPYQVNREQVKCRKVFWLIKRIVDVLCASIALLVLSPIILGFLLAIYIEDPKGSPIFVQERVGRKGKVFPFFKMRSMCVDAEEKLSALMEENQFEGKAFKIKDDPRITKVGHFIRNTSIDELPQLVNIIRGDMSIVGPRPPLPREVEQYDEYEMQRLSVTPGLTCFWQVYPKRHEISFDDWVAMDIKYIAERSLWVDVKLIIQTVVRIFKGHMD